MSHFDPDEFVNYDEEFQMAEAKASVPVPAVKESTAVVSWQEELAKMAVATAEAEKPSGNWVSFKGGRLTIGGNPMKDDKVQCVVVNSVFENMWYKSKYDPDNPQSPSCYAIAEQEDDLKPHKDAEAPQAATCAECPKNAWGSDPSGGRGKACKNVRRLAMIASTDLQAVPKAEVAVAKLPVTSVGNWSSYANQIASVLKLPPLAVITEMVVVPSNKTIFQVEFSLVDKITDGAVIQELLGKRKDTMDLMYAGYEKNNTAERPAEAARKF
jgi:hypothetical protein